VHGKITLKPVFNFDVTTVKSILKAIFYIPANMFKIFKAMRQADHIHLRCPGNTGLLGCVLQIFFPVKRKQYMLEIGIKSKTTDLQTQKNTQILLTRNIQVLIYGHGKDNQRTANHFTASYDEIERDWLEYRI
jgi:hypothetical protein